MAHPHRDGPINPVVATMSRRWHARRPRVRVFFLASMLTALSFPPTAAIAAIQPCGFENHAFLSKGWFPSGFAHGTRTHLTIGRMDVCGSGSSLGSSWGWVAMQGSANGGTGIAQIGFANRAPILGYCKFWADYSGVPGSDFPVRYYACGSINIGSASYFRVHWNTNTDVITMADDCSSDWSTCNIRQSTYFTVPQTWEGVYGVWSSEVGNLESDITGRPATPAAYEVMMGQSSNGTWDTRSLTFASPNICYYGTGGGPLGHHAAHLHRSSRPLMRESVMLSLRSRVTRSLGVVAVSLALLTGCARAAKRPAESGTFVATVLASPTSSVPGGFEESPPPPGAPPSISADQALAIANPSGDQEVSSATPVLVLFTDTASQDGVVGLLSWDVQETGCFSHPQPAPTSGENSSPVPCNPNATS
jgi:hypothetical protein